MPTDLDALVALAPDDLLPSDELLAEERVRLLAFIAAADVTAFAGVAEERRARTRGRSTRARRRVRWIVVPVAALAVGASAVYAATRGDGGDPTRVTCRFDAATTSVVDTVTGDPIADCTALWERTHTAAVPALRAYRVDGTVVVQRADATPPAGAEALPDDGSVDRGVVAAAELDALLHDYATGLYSQPCVPYADAVAKVEADLVTLGLSDAWTVRADPPPSGDACGLGFLDPETMTVVVRGVDRARWTQERSHPTEVALRSLGDSLAGAVTGECLAVAPAADLVQRRAVELGHPDAEVRTVVDPGADCSRVTVTAAGAVHVVVHGPRRTGDAGR